MDPRYRLNILHDFFTYLEFLMSNAIFILTEEFLVKKSLTGYGFLSKKILWEMQTTALFI